MARGVRSKPKSPPTSGTKNEVFEGNIHTENHNGNTITESSKDTFKYVDDVMRREVDKVIAGWGLSEVGDAKQTLTKALSTNMTWEEVERVFMQSDFWKRDGEPNLHTDSFTAHDGHVPLLNRVKIVFSQRSKKNLVDKKIGESEEFIPQAEDWYEAFMNNADIKESVKVDIGKMLEELATVNNLVLDSKGDPVGPVQRDQHGIFQKSFLDIGIIRLPDIDDPHVKVFVLKLTVWSQYLQKKASVRSGIRGALTSCTFRPRPGYLKQITDRVSEIRAKPQQKAVCMAAARGAADAVTFRTTA